MKGGRPLWNSLALRANALSVAASFALTAYILLPGLGPGTLLTGLRTFLAALVGWWWTVLLGRYLRGQVTPDTDGTLRALQVFFPWLTALRLSLWLLQLLSLGSVPGPQMHPVAVTAVLTLSLAYALAKNALYGTLARWAGDPAAPLGRTRLAEWLNVAAALALAIGVINTVPTRDAEPEFSVANALIYGGHAALDLLALGLSYLALRPPTAARRNEGA